MRIEIDLTEITTAQIVKVPAIIYTVFQKNAGPVYATNEYHDNNNEVLALIIDGAAHSFIGLGIARHATIFERVATIQSRTVMIRNGTGGHPRYDGETLMIQAQAIVTALEQGKIAQMVIIDKSWPTGRGAKRGATDLRNTYVTLSGKNTLEIPTGVYYNPTMDNFYGAATGRGQGDAFYRDWIGHVSKFPTTARAAG